MARVNLTFKIDDDASFEALMKGLAKSPKEMVTVARTLPNVKVRDLPPGELDDFEDDR